MTDKIKKLAVPILLALVVLFFGLWIYSESSKSVSFGGLVHNVQEIFAAGIKAGSSAEEVIDSSGRWVGSLLLGTSDSVTLAGTNTFSGATTISGAATFSSTVVIEKSASSTLQIGNSGAGVGIGCILLGDSGGATSTPVYITATGATITATTTRPANCATAQ